MNSIGPILREIREDKGMQLASAYEATGIEVSLLSRIETGKRFPTDEQLQILSQIYDYPLRKLRVQCESDRIITLLEEKDITKEALQLATEKLSYGEQYLSLFQDDILEKPIALESRRYIGSKAKLTAWIMGIIEQHTEDAHSFCDIFAGTGTVANHAAPKFDRVIVNDFLYSNNVIYKAFFGGGSWNREKVAALITFYNSLRPFDLGDNWFSKNYGDKYYEYGVAKHIGFIRQHIEDNKPLLTEKEYNILLATLIYNIDKLANTVGHFDAYIKKPIKPQPLVLRMIDAKSFDNVEIHREDSNQLARSIHSDIVYIDPPYNSRQYCRFYHLYETLVKWNKPELFGVAMKPAAENMSAYCSVKAVDAFEDLVAHLDTRYIVVSYNNTYNSKSSSSENKIQLDDIKRILNKLGPTEVFEHSHQFFNAGKTEFDDHKELLFVTHVHEGR